MESCLSILLFNFILVIILIISVIRFTVGFESRSFTFFNNSCHLALDKTKYTVSRVVCLIHNYAGKRDYLYHFRDSKLLTSMYYIVVC